MVAYYPQTGYHRPMCALPAFIGESEIMSLPVPQWRSTVEANALAATLEDVATDDDGRLVQALWRAGLNDGGLHRLLRLGAVYRHYRAELDGLEADPRSQFGRWLVANGRLHEG